MKVRFMGVEEIFLLEYQRKTGLMCYGNNRKNHGSKDVK